MATREAARAQISFLVGTTIIFIIFTNIDNNQKTVANAFTLFGTYFSLYGLLIAYLQIKSIKETSEETKKAVELSAIRVNQILSVSDLSKSSRTILEIQTYLQANKHELALVRMRDLKSILIQIKSNDHLLDYTNDNLYNHDITNLGADINNLHDHITSGKKTVNVSRINQNLEKLSSTLMEFENKLKYKRL